MKRDRALSRMLPLELGVVNRPTEGVKTGKTVLSVLCDCEVLAELKFCPLEAHFMKPSDYHETLLNKVLGFVQGEGLLVG
jgi:hypothetical protein